MDSPWEAARWGKPGRGRCSQPVQERRGKPGGPRVGPLAPVTSGHCTCQDPIHASQLFKAPVCQFMCVSGDAMRKTLFSSHVNAYLITTF